MDGSIFEEMESAVASYCRSFPATFVRACGAELWDDKGKRYLDFLAGAGALNYGHNNPVLKTALVDYIASDAPCMSLDLHTEAKADFLQTFRDVILTPRQMQYRLQFTGPTGTNAVEAAMKLARKITGRQTIASFTNGFHGMSLGALGATGNGYHRSGAGVGFTGTALLPYDGYLGQNVDTLDYFEALLNDPSSGLDLPAAVILECLQGEGGLNAARPAWLRRLSDLCKAHGIILIVDDIQAGCGRTGDFFSFEAAGIRPDIVTLSKSLSGYGLPLSVVMIAEGLDHWQPGQHNGTFRGNNTAFVTGRVTLDHYWQTDEFSRRIRALASRVRDHLSHIAGDYPLDVSGLRGRGMMQGIVCSDPDHAALVTGLAYDAGLIIERAGPRDEVIKVFAPLTISDAQLDEGLDILRHAFERADQRRSIRAA